MAMIAIRSEAWRKVLMPKTSVAAYNIGTAKTTRAPTPLSVRRNCLRLLAVVLTPRPLVRCSYPLLCFFLRCCQSTIVTY